MRPPKKPERKSSFANTIKGSLYWWLRYDKPFIINDEYSLKLLHIDKNKDMVKILITNLKAEKEKEEAAVETALPPSDK
jgi:ribosomal protein S1